MVMLDSKTLSDAVRTIVDVNLRILPDEEVLFFTDSNSSYEIATEKKMIHRREFLHRFYAAFEALHESGLKVIGEKYESTHFHGYEPRETVWRRAFGDRFYSRLLSYDYVWKLKEEVRFEENEWARIHSLVDDYRDDIVDAVVAFAWYSTTHTRFRKLLTYAGSRYVSMPLLTQGILDGPMSADWEEVAARTDLLHGNLLKCKRLRMTCPAGSDLTLEMGRPELVHKDTGLFHEPGSYGNLPAGEAYVVPAEGSAEGVVVFQSAPDRESIEPTAVRFSQGKATKILGGTPYGDELSRKFDENFSMRHFAEFGIGTNPQANDVSSMIEGEKILGTVHVAIGDDSSIGGHTEAREHLDHIITHPTLEAVLKDDRVVTLIRSGMPQW